MRLGEMRRHPSYAYFRSDKKNGTEKMMNDKTKLVKEAKKRQSKSLLLVRLSKKD